MISATTSTPLITATPKSEMKPTAADTLRLTPRTQSATTPPTSENGTLISTNPAWLDLPKAENSNPKISAIVTGRIR